MNETMVLAEKLILVAQRLVEAGIAESLGEAFCFATQLHKQVIDGALAGCDLEDCK